MRTSPCSSTDKPSVSPSPKGLARGNAHSASGFALVLVITTIALLLILIVTFLGYSAKELHNSKTDSSYVDAHQWVQASSDQILRDLLSEIAAGSVNKGGLYPATPFSAVPDRSSASDPNSGFPATPANLLKQSRAGRDFYNPNAVINGQTVFPQSAKYPVSQRSSTISTEAGGAETAIRRERWNTALLLPKKNTSSVSDYTAADSGETRLAGNPKAKWSWQPPDWIYLLADGQSTNQWKPEFNHKGGTPVFARYAYQMYDIGGLLDANVAGYDPDSTIVGGSTASRKGSIGFADLTQIGFKDSELNALLQYRNGSALAGKNGAPHRHRYANFLLNSQANLHFLRVTGKSAVTTLSDRGFQSRANLISFVQQLTTDINEKARLVGTLQYLTHFSRGLEQPSFTPGFYDPSAPGSTPENPVFTGPRIVSPAGKVDDRLYSIDTVNVAFLGATNLRRIFCLPYEMALGNNRGGNDAWGTVEERVASNSDKRTLQEMINPSLLDVRVTATFQRQDGTPAQTQEPLVKKRFPLERLAWITRRGPSALLPNGDPQFNAAGTVKAVYECFGLSWQKAQTGSFYWRYSHGKLGGIFKLEDLQSLDQASGGPREPDFFELLKAGIAVGSIGKSAVTTHQSGVPWDVSTYQQARDRKTEFQIIEIGANLIDQYDEDSFPTIIRLPNPDPQLTTAEARDEPPLFTAKGVEDLPYFYRFHWRAIEDGKDRPNIQLPPPGGMREITDTLKDFEGSAFNCGTTVLMGFPEIWNPHSANSTKPLDSSKTPKRFRIVAASEAPYDLIEGGKSDPTNLGLSNLPKLGATVPSLSSLWLSLVNNINNDFTLRPVGFFGYANANGNCLTLLDNVHLGTNSTDASHPMTYHSTSQTWEWPIDNHQTTSLINSNKRFALYWNDAPSFDDSLTPLQPGKQIKNYFLAAAPMWKIPALTSSGSLLLQAEPYPSWPSTSTTYKNKLIKAKLLSELPLVGDADMLYQLGSDSYIWDGGTYSLYPYPICPDISKVALSHGYTVRGTPLFYTSGKPVPNPFPPYQTYLRALTDKPGAQRVIFESNPTLKKIPGTTPTSAGNAYSNRTVDLRGTEMVFQVTDHSLFREPTTLCQPELPKGSALGAGADNFYSAAPYNGAVTDHQGTRWIGMSLGEVPSQFLLATKLFSRAKHVDWVDASNQLLGLKWTASSDSPSVDLLADKHGTEYPNPPPPSSASFRWLRTFQVPVTTVSIGSTNFTVRLQFEDANGFWVTYDERFIYIPSGDGTKSAASAVLGRTELEPVNLSSPQDSQGNVAWKNNNRPLSWGLPVVASFDPRTPRFGQPTRLSNKSPSSVRGTDAKTLQLLNPTATNSNGLAPDGNNVTDRLGNTLIDLPVKGTKPQVMNYHWLVPAYWNQSMFAGTTNGPKFPESYLYASGKKPADSTGQTLWWATAKEGGSLLLQKPSANAFDYGWLPRLLNAPSLAGATPVPTTFNSGFKVGISPEPNIPNFAQSGSGSNYADSLRTGSFSENVAPSPSTPTDPSASYRQAYADPDDVVRRAWGALASIGGYSSAMDGLALAQNSTFSPLSNRPVMLDRPFRSVAEMGYAFRGEPWKHLSFSLPETGDAALLDLFCLSEPPPLSGTAQKTPAPPVVAGKTNLNTRQEAVLRALLSGALKDEFKSSEVLGSAKEAAKAASALIDRTTGTKPWLGPLANLSELAGKLVGRDMTGITSADPVYTSTVYRTSTEPMRNPDIQTGKKQATWHFSGYSADLGSVFENSRDNKNQRLRESTIRALIDGGQTRVWNVMLDLVVQTGHLNKSASSLANFQKTAEAHVWVYLAIDRFTGEVLERQLEWVYD